ncbi:MAG: GNAT family N-acetyltransferase [Lachnospiraceae bacterium]|nr:GNAT family N-acetyltransferase [Lachnospiraceae bacterium]
MEGEAIIGICGYYVPKIDNNAMWLGWLAINDEYRKKGYATKAIEWLQKECSEKLHINTFRVYTARDNEPALALYKKLGYVQENTPHKIAIVLTKNGEAWGKEPVW